ncbi:PREDICTED: transcription initiation factor IIA subunit 1-like [Nelumbo nucifera]|uniref:Transcription initiation factor IIA large subunit-like n=2 Tax=Nelumbo nucifera TaxID=4432 RepID=A0A822Y2M1_NELNU|nr:PREDICTED: transcription initiation factor IIA subunit 1-like [Nelumbo nucifera]DAD26502.1 TPA_asm: hypothetical protein HUJ06_027970 [Nelumbo nucifera]
MSSTTSQVYIQVIEDVIDKVRNDFINGGPGEGVLNELQALWEMKMMQFGAICGPIERSSLPKAATGGAITPVHDLNMPYEGTEEYETPTADMLFPPTPLQTPIQTPLPGTVDNTVYNLPGPNDYPTPHDTGSATDVKVGRPSPYMQPPSPWMNQRTLGVDVNVAYVEGRDEVERGNSHQPMTQDFFISSGKRKREDFAPHFHTGPYIPQQDGAGDVKMEGSQAEAGQVRNSPNRFGKVMANGLLLSQIMTASKIPQYDGPTPDGYEDIVTTPGLYPYQGVASEDYNTVNTPSLHDIQVGTPAVGAQNEGGDGDDDDDEPPLNENDDDDDLDDVDQGEEPNMQQLVLAQFEKVTRTKSKWKCTLKDGVMHIKDKDILFNKATGEFDF